MKLNPSRAHLDVKLLTSQLTNMANARDIMHPGLCAIALVIRAREGPRFVFHYPPHPDGKAVVREARFGTELDTEPISPVLEGEESDEEFGEEENIGGEVEHGTDADGTHVAPWDRLWEFPTADLESILTPSRAFHKRRFELSLDPVVFVSYPVHIREEGGWKKKRFKKSRRRKEGEREGEEAKESMGKEEEEDEGGMTMFNVVFMVNVSREEEDGRVQEVFEHVVKKFNKALNHAQASDNYVWKESEMILGMKDKAREERRPMSWLWNEILLKSTLASAIRDVFDAISNSKIATLHLATTPPVDISLQIPIPCFLTSFPSSDDRAMLGLLLTSANAMIDEEGNENPTHLNKHFALLLLNNEEKIISEIQADNTELTAPLIECIRLCKPTLSFLQVAQTQNVELSSLLILAQHLIYWRRAIAIPPLHARETYIVSPNCDSRQLPIASIAWKKAFPLAPSLPSYLASLSAAPRPYKHFSPSKNHRPTYLDMLAWAMRGGWVTPLRTYAWILVHPEIIYEVDYQLKAAAVEKARNKSKTAESDQDLLSSSTDSSTHFPKDPNSMTTSQAAEHARLARLARKTAEETAIFAAEFEKLPPPVATAHPSLNTAPHLKHLSPYVIKDPHKVSHEESLYIAAYSKRFEDVKVRETWLRFCGRYFNGREPLEMIALREGMKRKETWGLLAAFGEVILVARHW